MAGEAMKCSECGSENPEGSRFCNECGSKLDLACSECGTPNPPASKFCNQCGHNLVSPPTATLPTDLSFDEKLRKIQKYLPGGLTEKILSQRDRIEGERRHVTIMFVDMKGFTPLTEKLGPEETFSLMDKVFEVIIHKVHDYEGTVNEMRGDGVLAFFGAPIALEDAPQRAIRSSLAIHRELTRFNDKLRAEKNIPPVLVRIGINSGPVVVGTVGNDLRVQFTAVGDTINMAARMEQLAEPGTTYVTEDTFKLTEGLFRFEALGEKEIKGKEKPMKVYQVIAPSTRRTRFDVSAERGLSKLIGRARELDLLLDAFGRAKEGRGQAVSIVGEAGVGKSRLLYEFRKAVANEDILFLEGKCLSYSRGVAYYPITDILKANFSIEDQDTDSNITEKVKTGLTLLGAEEGATLPYLLELLPVKDSGIDKIPISPEARKERILEALKTIVVKGAEWRPLILAIEDLHWMDISSEDVVKDLLSVVPGTRLVLIFTYRPSFAPAWGTRSYHSQVTLNRFSKKESGTMISYLMATERSEERFEDVILQRAEGIPFFIEEFVRSVKELKTIQADGHDRHASGNGKDLTVPATINDVIMARVDSLPENARQLVQTGAVIEREFPYSLVKRLTGLPDQELLSQLSVLTKSELLYEHGMFPHSTYVFNHALTREVVYDSILPDKKKKLHDQIAVAIEELCGDNLGDHYGILAEHYLEAENHEKAAEALRMAGKRAARKGSLSEAIAHTERRIAALERLPHTDHMEQRLIDARMFLGFYYSQTNRHVAAYHAVEPVVDLAAKHDNPKQLSMIYTITGSYKSFVREDFEHALKDLKKAVELSEATQSFGIYAQANFWLGGTFYQLACDFESGLNHFQKALQLVVAINSLWSIASIKSNISGLRCFQGSPSIGLEMSEEAVRIAEESADVFSKCHAYVTRGFCLYCSGFLEEATNNLSLGAEFGSRGNYFFWEGLAHLNLGEIFHVKGDFPASVAHHEKAVRFTMRSEGWPSWLTLCKTGLILANIMHGKQAVDLESIRLEAINSKPKLMEGWIRRNLGEIFLNIDGQHFPEAQHWIEEAMEADERNGMRWHLGRDIAVYAEFFKRKGDREKAKDQLGKAIDIYKECGADGWVTRAEEEMAKLS
jgi:class 3 adenylate cyclase/tetratricopeptide (TPR) repeat protein